MCQGGRVPIAGTLAGALAATYMFRAKVELVKHGLARCIIQVQLDGRVRLRDVDDFHTEVDADRLKKEDPSRVTGGEKPNTTGDHANLGEGGGE